MIPVACMHKETDNKNSLIIDVDEHRYVVVSENNGCFWIECGTKTLRKRDMIISYDSGHALFQLLGEHLGYFKSPAPDKMKARTEKMNARHGKRPQAATIRAVVEHLDSLGLSVYGRAADLKAGVYYEGGSLMDYDADDVLALRKLEDKGGMEEPEQP